MFVLELGSNAIKNDTKIMGCIDCGSRFIYNENDIITGVDVDYSSIKYLLCPVCGKYIELEKERDALATAFSNLLGLNLNNG